MSPAFSTGTLPLWRHPIVKRTQLRGVDVLQGSYKTPLTTTLSTGDPCPGFPGMIIVELTHTTSGISHEWQITAEGSLDESYPTKILSRGKRRTIEAGWDERSVRYLSWHAAWKSCTGVASTGVITCNAHGFQNGRRVFFARLTGGSSLVPQSHTSLGVPYFVIDRTADTFKVSLTSGGSAAALGSNISAGEVIAGEFALGASHPSHPYLYLCDLSHTDDNTDFVTADCTYRGFEEAKPYHRMITVNGQQFSASEPITVSLTGGWMDARHTNFHLPEIVVTDTYLAGAATLPSSTVPSMSTPADAPAIASIVLTDDPDNLTYNYPYGWTVVATPTQATLNSQIAAMVYQIVYRYIHPVMFR
jgi:hypothetical protein